jgi:translation elongation factor EF-1beta
MFTHEVKPWDDETDMKKLEESVRSIAMDGLLWGPGKLIPFACGVKKLQITCFIEDDKVMILLRSRFFI